MNIIKLDYFLGETLYIVLQPNHRVRFVPILYLWRLFPVLITLKVIHLFTRSSTWLELFPMLWMFNELIGFTAAEAFSTTRNCACIKTEAQNEPNKLTKLT